MRHGEKVFAVAMLGSLFAHLATLAAVGDWWTLPREEVPFPLEARLEIAKPMANPKTGPSPSPPPAVPRSPPAPVETEPALSPPLPAPAPEPSTAPAVPAAVPAPQAVVLEPPPGPAAASASAAESRPGVRTLPERLVLVYDVRAGEDGFSLGQATYTWQTEEGRYRLESVAQATGLVSLFVSGRIVQTSEGRLGPAGLVPDEFAQTRGGRHADRARFDWDRRVLVLPQGEETLRDATQDLLSFPFHLAMTLDPELDYWMLPVTDGRRLKGYRFTLVGRETVDVGGQGLDALHVRGTRAFEGTLDVWLAPSRHWLPVRIRTEDQKGKVIILTLARLEG